MVPDYPQEVLSALPALILDIARVTSTHVAVLIAEKFGGRRVYFSSKPNPNGKLAKAIGIDAARALASQYGGESMDIPRCIVLRNRKIHARLDLGIPLATVAQEFELCTRTVRRIRNTDTLWGARPRSAGKSKNTTQRSDR